MVHGCRFHHRTASRPRDPLMASDGMSGLRLPDATKAVVWRIFGPGASPLRDRSTYELIEPIISKYVAAADQDRAIAEVRGWFESHGDRHWLKSDMREAVAALILEGIGSDRSETAIWAIGSISADFAASYIRSHWEPEEIDSLVEAALAALEKLCGRDEVLNATQIPGFSVSDSRAKIPKDAVEQEGWLETFRHLDGIGFELVHMGLHTAAGNLIKLVVDMRPGQFEFLVKRLDHPVMQARAAYHMLAAALPLDHRKTLQWIAKNSCDALVALAIVHTLNTVNRLDQDIRSAEHSDAVHHNWSTELRPPRDDLDAAAAGLLTGLVDRLAVLDPLVCARWIGELLSHAPYVLYGHGDSGKPPRRIEQLERACTELLVRLVRQAWSDDLLGALRDGLCLTPRATWTRHLAEVAWALRDVAAARATEIARATLDEDERHIAEELERNHLFLNWDNWQDREWISGLGIALALSCETLDLPKWVAARCRVLPLSVWDADDEEHYGDFSTADRAAQHWFLVAFHAIAPQRELGRKIDPASVRALVESLWTHCHFVGQYRRGHRPEVSIAVELAARYAIEFGEPSDTWLLNQARAPGVGPLALWVLIHQRMLKRAREGRTDAHYDEMITAEFARIASDRFGDGRRFNLEALRFWGKLWLLLGAIDEAEQTARAILAFPLRNGDRAAKILALRLFALVVSKRKPIPEIENYTASLYNQLWPGYTLSEERETRQQIDDLLGRSG